MIRQEHQLYTPQDLACRGPDSMTMTSWGWPGPGWDLHHIGGANGTSAEGPKLSPMPAARIFQLVLAALPGASGPSAIVRQVSS